MLTGKIPYVPKAFRNSATSKFGVDEFPKMMAAVCISIPKGRRLLGSNEGICFLSQIKLLTTNEGIRSTASGVEFTWEKVSEFVQSK
jgi:hypothetical protein